MTQPPAPASASVPIDPARILRLLRGMSMTLRSMSSAIQDADGYGLSRKLAIQRFFKDLDGFIHEYETALPPSNAQPSDGSAT